MLLLHNLLSILAFQLLYRTIHDGQVVSKDADHLAAGGKVVHHEKVRNQVIDLGADDKVAED